MSLEIAAKKLAAKGRNGDTLLMHVHPKEVAGLQALARRHGTSLTLNPSTGLPEAFSLKSILPMIAGAVGGFYGGPAGGAAASAGMTKLMGGSNQAALMSGLGGYMGAGAMGSAAGDVMAEGAGEMAAGEMAAGAAPEVLPAGMAAEYVPPEYLAETPTAALDTSAAAQPQTLADIQPVQTPDTSWQAQRALQEPSATDQFAAWKDKMGGTQGLGKAGLGMLMQAGAVDPTKPDPQKIKMGIQKYSYDPRYQNAPITDSRERTQFGNQFTKGSYTDVSQYMATGGIARLAKGGSTPPASATGGYRPEQVYGAGNSGGYDPRTVYGAGATMPTLGVPQGAAAQTPSAQTPGAGATQKYTYDPASAGFSVNPAWQAAQDAQQKKDLLVSQVGTPGFDQGSKRGGVIRAAGGGGISSLGSYSDGGQLLRGPGDGVSDSIPATIDGHRPARLADGEFVVPARIVSELGNGSTEAGSKKLYAMLDRIQKARGKTVGKNRVAANSKADRHLPA